MSHDIILSPSLSLLKSLPSFLARAFPNLLLKGWKSPQGSQGLAHRKGTSNSLYILDCPWHLGETPPFLSASRFRIGSFTRCCSPAAVSTSFCHFCLSPPLVRAAETTPQLPPQRGPQSRHIPFPQVSPFD